MLNLEAAELIEDAAGGLRERLPLPGVEDADAVALAQREDGLVAAESGHVETEHERPPRFECLCLGLFQVGARDDGVVLLGRELAEHLDQIRVRPCGALLQTFDPPARNEVLPDGAWHVLAGEVRGREGVHRDAVPLVAATVEAVVEGSAGPERVPNEEDARIAACEKTLDGVEDRLLDAGRLVHDD